MKFIIFLLISTLTFSKVVIKDEVGLLSKQFIKEQESEYKDKNKEIHVLIKESIGNQNQVVWGAEYLQSNDLGGKYGSGIVMLIIMDNKTIACVIGYRVEEFYTDTQIVNNITKPTASLFKEKLFKEGVTYCINVSKSILNEVIK